MITAWVGITDIKTSVFTTILFLSGFVLTVLSGCQTGTHAWDYHDLCIITRPGEAYSFLVIIPKGTKSELVRAIELNSAKLELNSVTYDSFQLFAKETGERITVNRRNNMEISSIRTASCTIMIDDQRIKVWGNDDVILHLRTGDTIRFPAPTTEIRKKLGRPDTVRELISRQP